MDNELLPPPEEQNPPAKGCVNCDHPVIEPGYPTPLCSDCRQKFIRFPIPLGIKIFGICVALLVIAALFGTSKSLTAGVHYERGRNAIDQKKYATAERELNLVTKDVPGFTEASMYLAVASFYNHDMTTFVQTVQALRGEKVEEDHLFNELNSLTAKAVNYLPSDSFYTLLDQYSHIDSIPGPVLVQYMQQYPDELVPAVSYANLLFEKDQFAASDSVLSLILQKDPSYASALNLKVVNKRMMHQYDSAMHYAEQIILLNRESAYGISSKARTLLVQRKDQEGLQWALNAVKTDGKDGYALATLVLAYHCNNKIAERDQLLERMKKDSVDITYLQYPLDVIAGKEKFRD